MDFLTPGQANKLAKHITNSVTNMVTNKSTTFDQKVEANDQYLLDVQQRYAQVNTALTKLSIDVNGIIFLFRFPFFTFKTMLRDGTMGNTYLFSVVHTDKIYIN